MRNMWVRFTGGSYSRAGTAFVGYSKQTGRGYPPRLLDFQFNSAQGLALEFGNLYMRVVFDGAFVTENALPITAATRANPCVITAPATGASSATPITGGIYSSYAVGEQVTLAGGSYSIPAVLQVNTTTLLSIQPQLGSGTGYVPADTVTLAGGTSSPAAVITVGHTQVNSATIVNAGTGGTPGGATLTGTTGTGTKFQATCIIDSTGKLQTISSISVAGNYSVNPTVVTAEPVTGGGLTGATLNLAMGICTLSVTTHGTFTVNAPGGVMTQASTSGSGTGAVFVSGLFGPNGVTFSNPGSYTVFPANPVSQASTTGAGGGCTFTVATASSAAWNTGDWVYLSGVGGMTQLNGLTCVVTALGGGTYSLYNVFGGAVNSTSFSAYTSGGSGARIYTLATPWGEADLKWLKITQSADTLSVCCVNQDTGTEYPPYDLLRNSDSNWTLTQVTMAPTVNPPPWCTLAATGLIYQVYTSSGVSVGVGSSWASYSYCVTSVNAIDGTESVASPLGQAANVVDIAAQQGTITINWGPVAGVNQYNIYKATPGYANQPYNPAPIPPVGAQYGFIGSAFGTRFLDQNIVADFAQTPPTHQNPFARGQISGCTPTAPGSGYTTATATITTSTGSGAVIAPVVLSGQVAAYVIQDAGHGYLPADTVTISGNGSGATAVLAVGAQTGTYPSVPFYFQQRRGYAATINSPDSYWMSQSGSFKNFDTRIPTISTDAITGTPWSQQVNGIQFTIQMPGGLVVLTGLGAWQVGGQGSSALNPQPITPSSQQAQPQAFYGCSSYVPPIVVNYDIIYVESLSATYRDLAYQFFTNIYTGTDLTINSSHLFINYSIREHAWCRTPYKLLWAVRSDGALLSMTYLKEQEVLGWSRHDTNGLFFSACSVQEPPVDALYLAVYRTFGAGAGYVIERMDDRQWTTIESTWCVDCGLTLAQPTPAATLYISSPDGIGSLSGVTSLVGGTGYSSGTTATVVDANGIGPGSGAVPILTIVAGVITGVSFSPAGSGYTSPTISVVDPAHTGSGFSATITLNSAVTLTTSASVFSVGSVGQIVRAFGGIATITGYTSGTSVTGQVTSPFTSGIQPNSGGLMQFALSGTWTLSSKVSSVSIPHLASMTVTGIADGVAIPPTVVSAAGILTLASPASAITVGLGFQAQFQSVYLDAGGEATIQGQRKKVAAATVRVDQSLGLKMGSNQVDGSTLSPMQLAPTWTNLNVVPDLAVPPYGSSVVPLYTGDIRIPVQGGYQKPGQVALQQDNPYPMSILALIPEVLEGDQPEQQAKPRQQPQKGQRQ